MGRGRPKARLVVAPREREALERWSRRPKTAQALALRARIVLRCAQGKDNGVVAEELGVTRQMVGKWRQRFVAAIYQQDEKALFIDGALVERQPIDLHGGEPARFSGRLILGNSPTGRSGWWGEVHGLAVYGRALTSDEISRDARVVRRDGLRPLAEEAAVLALYPFDEGEGGTARALASDAAHIQWPGRFAPLAGSMLRYPGDDGRDDFIDVRDMLQNLILFLPLGYIVCMIATKRGGAIRRRRLSATVLFAGCLSAGIEIAQIYLPSRSPSTMDIAWNTTGAFLGALLWYRAEGRRLRQAPRQARA